jgi:hypothetical protein
VTRTKKRRKRAEEEKPKKKVSLARCVDLTIPKKREEKSFFDFIWGKTGLVQEINKAKIQLDLTI